MRAVALLVITAACADPVVEMQLVLPKTTDMTTSCLTAVEVHANGSTYPSVQSDSIKSCIEVTAGATYASVRDAIKGKFELTIPDSGLSSLEIYGWSGPAACTDDMTPFFSPNLVFFGGAEYIGQDQIDLPMIPNLDCTPQPVKVRMIDMFALIGGATCANAGAPGANPNAGIGTMMPKLHDKGIDFFGNIDGGNAVNGLVSFEGHSRVGTKSCLAVDGATDTGGSTACVVGGTNVCAAPDEIEQTWIANPILQSAFALDSTLSAKYPGQIIGSVWSATKTPVAGATVEVDPAHGKVVYIDAPPTGSSQVTMRSQPSTGPSGLFILYTDTVIAAKVTAGSATRTVTLGAFDQATGGAMIVMP